MINIKVLRRELENTFGLTDKETQKLKFGYKLKSDI